MTMRIHVDTVLCESNGICAGIIPEVFELDDDDRLELLREELTADIEPRVRDAVVQCPRHAISLVE
ncbi:MULTISPECIES: ferredoxin [Nocardia]|uniref:ferredoxin n=1 Tax=Nocardia TaxID=1817 RepID=UPI000D69AE14|nr:MULTISPECIES: ferredoxin [Nocardia]